MRKPAAQREDAVRRAAEVFREHGFEGASVTRLAAATGLSRSSLYHHFPEGKPEMAAESARLAASDFQELVIDPLLAPGEPAARLRRAIEGLDAFYHGGAQSCLIEHFSIPDGVAAAPAASRMMALAALAAFARLAADAGAGKKDADARAERALIDIQGALVVSRALGDPRPFRTALKGLSAALLPA